MDKEWSEDFIMGALVMAIYIEFQRQGVKSIEKITELIEEMWHDKFAKFPESLFASIKNADAAIPRERIGDLLQQALRVGATEEQVDNALEQPKPRQALLSLIKSMQDRSGACVKDVVTAPSDVQGELKNLKAKATKLFHKSQIRSPSSMSGLQSTIAMRHGQCNQTARPLSGSGFNQHLPNHVASEALVKPCESIGSPRDKEITMNISDALEQVGPKIILIIGSTGDGKSTIVNHLKIDVENQALVSMEVKGTTKNIKEYRGRNGMIIIDTPGVGDYDVSVLQLYALLEEALSQKDRRIDYVVVTTPLNNVRFHLALQIVQLLVEKGFRKDDGREWNHIIFCGTKKDRAEPEELDSFQHLVDAFYEKAPAKTGSCVMVDRNDISELEKAIGKKTTKKIAFQAVGENELAIELSAKLGFEDNEEFLAVLRQEREQLKAK